MILAEMEKHEDAWPFLVPVNPKQVRAMIRRFLVVCQKLALDFNLLVDGGERERGGRVYWPSLYFLR